MAGLAKSVERYRRSWIAKGRFYTEAEREAWGCALGLRSGLARRKGSNEELRPWEAEGIHRAMWYRRRGEDAAGRDQLMFGGGSMGKRLTQAQIAALHGVSQPTVSYVVRRAGHSSRGGRAAGASAGGAALHGCLPVPRTPISASWRG